MTESEARKPAPGAEEAPITPHEIKSTASEPIIDPQDVVVANSSIDGGDTQGNNYQSVGLNTRAKFRYGIWRSLYLILVCCGPITRANTAYYKAISFSENVHHLIKPLIYALALFRGIMFLYVSGSTMFEKASYLHPRSDLKSGVGAVSLEESLLYDRLQLGYKLGLKERDLLDFILIDIAQRTKGTGDDVTTQRVLFHFRRDFILRLCHGAELPFSQRFLGLQHLGFKDLTRREVSRRFDSVYREHNKNVFDHMFGKVSGYAEELEEKYKSDYADIPEKKLKAREIIHRYARAAHICREVIKKLHEGKIDEKNLNFDKLKRSKLVKRLVAEYAVSFPGRSDKNFAHQELGKAFDKYKECIAAPRVDRKKVINAFIEEFDNRENISARLLSFLCRMQHQRDKLLKRYPLGDGADKVTLINKIHDNFLSRNEYFQSKDIGENEDEFSEYGLDNYLPEDSQLRIFFLDRLTRDRDYYDRCKAFKAVFDALLKKFKGDVDHQGFRKKLYAQAEFRKLQRLYGCAFKDLQHFRESESTPQNISDDEQAYENSADSPESESAPQTIADDDTALRFQCYYAARTIDQLRKARREIQHYTTFHDDEHGLKKVLPTLVESLALDYEKNVAEVEAYKSIAAENLSETQVKDLLARHAAPMPVLFGSKKARFIYWLGKRSARASTISYFLFSITASIVFSKHVVSFIPLGPVAIPIIIAIVAICALSNLCGSILFGEKSSRATATEFAHNSERIRGPNTPARRFRAKSILKFSLISCCGLVGGVLLLVSNKALLTSLMYTLHLSMLAGPVGWVLAGALFTINYIANVYFLYNQMAKLLTSNGNTLSNAWRYAASRDRENNSYLCRFGFGVNFVIAIIALAATLVLQVLGDMTGLNKLLPGLPKRDNVLIIFLACFSFLNGLFVSAGQTKTTITKPNPPGKVGFWEKIARRFKRDPEHTQASSAPEHTQALSDSEGTQDALSDYTDTPKLTEDDRSLASSTSTLASTSKIISILGNKAEEDKASDKPQPAKSLPTAPELKLSEVLSFSVLQKTEDYQLEPQPGCLSFLNRFC